jgi:hypothetical protein
MPRPSFIEHFNAVIRRTTRNFERVALLVNLVDRVIPGTSALVSNLLLKRARLPFRCSSIRVVGWGSGCTVFLLKTAAKQFVLKVYRDTFGLSREQMLCFAHSGKVAFETVVSQFTTQPDIIIPTYFTVIQGPLLGMPVSAALQDYVESDRRDLCNYSCDELGDLLSCHDKLRVQVALFVENTRRALNEGGFVIDLLGKENVVLQKQCGQYSLLSTDTEMVDSADLKRIDPRKHARYVEYVERLGRALRAAQVNTSIYENHSYRSCSDYVVSD